VLCPLDQGAMADAAVAKRICRLLFEIMIDLSLV
jgi:hypothetical protein